MCFMTLKFFLIWWSFNVRHRLTILLSIKVKADSSLMEILDCQCFCRTSIMLIIKRLMKAYLGM